MTVETGNFVPFAERMRGEDLPEIAIRTFELYYRQLAEGVTGMIPEAEISPIDDLPDMEAFPPETTARGEEALPRTVMLKLNGGLGTGMGLEKAKSLLTVKNGLTFLDIIARQALDARIPLVLMDSYSTRDDTLDALAAYPDLAGRVPLDFLQHKVPKIVQADLRPAECPAAPEKAWCPPGHGDLYTALVTSGMLDLLLKEGFHYAFVSNSDNLGAVCDATLLGFMIERDLPFLAETADRTAADRKGGHLARRGDGQLIVRESAQCPDADEAAFQDIDRHRYFNTNSLWIDLTALEALMEELDGILGLPMIRNAKTVDPRDDASTPVYQLETAMGAAIQVFRGAGAVRVPRTRFAPIKATNDLLDVRSDNYVLTDDFRVVANPARALGKAFIDLDKRFYKMVDDFDARFPHGPPSLLACEKLVVNGDVRFGRDVVLKGAVEMVNEGDVQAVVPDGAVIEGTWRA